MRSCAAISRIVRDDPYTFRLALRALNRSRALAVVDAGALRPLTGTLTHPDAAARRMPDAAMQPAVWRLLQVPTALGRLPGADDAATLVLGWSLYEELGRGPRILGERVDVDGVPHTVIGVMPACFGFPERHAFWDGAAGRSSSAAPTSARCCSCAASSAPPCTSRPRHTDGAAPLQHEHAARRDHRHV